MKSITCAVSLLAIAATSVAMADEQVTSTEAVKIDFRTLDQDANGNLSREEVKGVTELTGQFDTLDADHDRALSRPEFQRWHRANTSAEEPRDPTTAPGGSAGAQHMPERD
ncbi:MAG TPA: hypothetical protein VNQ32_07055 [Steroidobacteraceae bacterium]|nr:hypothetical protein [Steroidobacteraceae bacterium]